MVMKFIIIGNGVAGTTAASILSQGNSEVSVLLFSESRYPYYYRPRLPMMLGDEQITNEDVFAYDHDWYDQKGIELHLEESVEELITSSRKIITSKGEYVYDSLLLATGALCFVPPAPSGVAPLPQPCH